MALPLCYPQKFFQGTCGRLLKTIDNHSRSTFEESFLYLSVEEFAALLEMAQENLAAPKLNKYRAVNKISSTNINHSLCTLNIPDRVYPSTSLPTTV